jgi:hypothetical protein
MAVTICISVIAEGGTPRSTSIESVLTTYHYPDRLGLMKKRKKYMGCAHAGISRKFFQDRAMKTRKTGSSYQQYRYQRLSL